VGPDDIKPNPELVKAIFNFPQPQTLKQLQSFLGLINYYRKFIKNYSRIAAPLTDDPDVDINKRTNERFDKAASRLHNKKGILVMCIPFDDTTGHVDLWDGNSFTSENITMDENGNTVNHTGWMNKATRISLWVLPDDVGSSI